MANQKLVLVKRPEADASTPASFVMYPQPEKESGIGKFGSFMLGVVTGAVALGATAAVVENWDNIKETISSGASQGDGDGQRIIDVTPRTVKE